MQMSHKLLVLVQHSSRAMPDEQAVGRVLQTTLEHHPPASIQRWLAENENPQMELFLRVTGSNQVYASGIFDLHPDRRSLPHLPIPPLVPVPTVPEALAEPPIASASEAEQSPDLESSPSVNEVDTEAGEAPVNSAPDVDRFTEPVLATSALNPDESLTDTTVADEVPTDATVAIEAEHDLVQNSTDLAFEIPEPDAQNQSLIETLDVSSDIGSGESLDVGSGVEQVEPTAAIAPSLDGIPRFDEPDEDFDEDLGSSFELDSEQLDRDVLDAFNATEWQPLPELDAPEPPAIAPEIGADLASVEIPPSTDTDLDISEEIPPAEIDVVPDIFADFERSEAADAIAPPDLEDRANQRFDEFFDESEEDALSDGAPSEAEVPDSPPAAIVPLGDRASTPDRAIAPSEVAARELVAISPPTLDSTPPPQIRKRWFLGGIAGLVAIVGGIYALTRPCVLGECQNLTEAQTLDAQATALIQSPQSAQDAVDAYDQWADASYLLQQIPPWSRSYAQAQRLLSTYEQRMNVLNNVVQAQRQAYTAAVKSQNPPHPVDVWREVRVLWQEAIALLRDVPPESTIYPLAQQKLQEYETNLKAIDGRIETERAAQSKIQSAREAATVAEARQQGATSLQEWQQTQSTWQTAIALLQQVPANTMSHAEAQQLLDIYQQKLSGTRDRLQQETIAQSAYQQSLNSADQAASYEDSQQWSQAVASWRDALNQAQQVPKETTYYDQAQPLIESYSRSLEVAEDKLQIVVARQGAEDQLRNLCSTGQCTFAALSDRFQVRVIQPSVGAGSFPLPGSNQPISEPFNDLLRSVADIGQRSQVKIDVFNVDGTLFGTYTPEVNGYVPPSNSTTPEPYRF